MIIVNLKGGLGNQMFQYAAGFALAEKHGVELAADLSFLDQSKDTAAFTRRGRELDVFNLAYRPATSMEIETFKSKEKKIGYRVLRKFAPSLLKNRIYRYDALSFDPQFNSLGKNVYLDGYFQSEKYFLTSKDSIRKQFHFPEDPQGQNAVFAEKIKNSNSVSVHVRRGDYLKDINKGLFGGICTAEYYANAIRKMESETGNPQFFVFSDDPAWCRANLKFSSPVEFIDFNSGEKSYMDMYLMHLCKHNIIANSSFSWWGAWLNNNASKKIIAPSKWINAPDCNVNDVMPLTWIRI